MFRYVFAGFVLVLLAIDRVFLPNTARRTRLLLTVVFVSVAVLALFQKPMFAIAEALGVGRPVDLIVYVSVVLLFRELLVTRERFHRLEKRVVVLARAQALENVQVWPTPKP